MSESLRKFVHREPRYTLRPGDNDQMRFAQDAHPKDIHSSKILDLSKTGASFVVRKEYAPFIFDRIRVQIPLENNSIAWWAKVIRVQEYTPHRWFHPDEEQQQHSNEVIVAVQFEPLPVEHANSLQIDLRKKFNEVRKLRQRNAWNSAQQLWQNYTKEVVFYFAVIVLALGLAWLWSLPNPFHKAAKEAEWGKVIEKMQNIK